MLLALSVNLFTVLSASVTMTFFALCTINGAVVELLMSTPFKIMRTVALSSVLMTILPSLSVPDKT